MRKYLLIFAALLFTASVFAQAQTSTASWKLKRIGVFLGQDQDMLSTMNHGYFLSSLRNEPGFDFSNINATEAHTYSMLCENPHLRLNMVFQNQKHPNLELGASVVGIFDRIDEIHYATPNTAWGDPDRQQLRFTQYGNEIALESTLGYRLQAGPFALTGIVGANGGYHFGNYLDIQGQNITICDNTIGFRDNSDGVASEPCETIEHLYESGTQRNGFSVRAFAELNASFVILRRVEIGGMFRRGLGVRTINGGKATGTNLHSGGLYMRWTLR